VTGARYTRDEKDFVLCPTAGAACTGRFLPNSKSWTNTSPRVGVNFQANSNMFFYTYWARGFRAGGYNGEAGSASAAGPFDPERVDTFEIGAKIDTWSDRLRVNVALFDSSADDLQRILSRATAAGVAEIVTTNAAKATIRGAELEVTALPISGLRIDATLGYLDAKYDEYCNDLNGVAPNDPSLVSCAAPITTAAGTIQPVDLTGLPLARAPKWAGRLNGLYEFEMGGMGKLGLSAEWVYQDRELTLDQGAPLGTTFGIVNFNGEKVDPMRPSTNIYNASITWRDTNDRYRVALYGKNLSNEIYFRRLSFASPTLSFGTLNNPREYGIELTYDFGK
jgi:iron complex outermembrane receptor protein